MGRRWVLRGRRRGVGGAEGWAGCVVCAGGAVVTPVGCCGGCRAPLQFWHARPHPSCKHPHQTPLCSHHAPPRTPAVTSFAKAAGSSLLPPPLRRGSKDSSSGEDSPLSSSSSGQASSSSLALSALTSNLSSSTGSTGRGKRGRGGAVSGNSLRRWQYGVGCLGGHLLAGEESFAVEWDPADDSVWWVVCVIAMAGQATRIPRACVCTCVCGVMGGGVGPRGPQLGMPCACHVHVCACLWWAETHPHHACTSHACQQPLPCPQV